VGRAIDLEDAHRDQLGAAARAAWIAVVNEDLDVVGVVRVELAGEERIAMPRGLGVGLLAVLRDPVRALRQMARADLPVGELVDARARREANRPGRHRGNLRVARERALRRRAGARVEVDERDERFVGEPIDDHPTTEREGHRTHRTGTRSGNST